jgi:hypothetical protein
MSAAELLTSALLSWHHDGLRMLKLRTVLRTLGEGRQNDFAVQLIP